MQIHFEDPNREWTLVNAWFVKQLDFQTLFTRRDLVMPDAKSEKSHDGHSEQ